MVERSLWYDRMLRPAEPGLLDLENRHVAQTTIGDLWVSTVFLCLDHGWMGGPPVLFETMIFSVEGGGIACTDTMEALGVLDQYRYQTEPEAIQGHCAIVARLQTALELPPAPPPALEGPSRG